MVCPWGRVKPRLRCGLAREHRLASAPDSRLVRAQRRFGWSWRCASADGRDKSRGYRLSGRRRVPPWRHRAVGATDPVAATRSVPGAAATLWLVVRPRSSGARYRPRYNGRAAPTAAQRPQCCLPHPPVASPSPSSSARLLLFPGVSMNRRDLLRYGAFGLAASALPALPAPRGAGRATPTPATAAITHCVIHPAIGIARVGNSPAEWFLGPEVPGSPSDSGRRIQGRRRATEAAGGALPASSASTRSATSSPN